MKLAVCELPDGLTLTSSAWLALLERLQLERPDLLILNEMPLGRWIAERTGFDRNTATEWARH